MCINISGHLTVYFDCPFWVGVFEVYEGNSNRTCRVVFGSEPKAINSKRLQRQIHKSIERDGIGTTNIHYHTRNTIVHNNRLQLHCCSNTVSRLTIVRLYN